jgi:hypothetical protein
LQDEAFDTYHAVRLCVDPHAAFDAGKQVVDGFGGSIVFIGFEVDHDLPAGCSRQLRLPGHIGINHGLRHLANQLDGIIARGVIAPVVPDEVAGRGENLFQPLALGGVLLHSQFLAVALHQAGYCAVAGLNHLANDISLAVDLVYAVAEGNFAVILDDA